MRAGMAVASAQYPTMRRMLGDAGIEFFFFLFSELRSASVYRLSNLGRQR